MNETEDTWTFLSAMERSHRWMASVEANTRLCNECGDTLDSTVRYCPGGTPTPKVSVAERRIELPPLEQV